MGKGSTVGAYVLYQLKKKGLAPAAIVNVKADTTTASGAIISDIPMVHQLAKDPLKISEDSTVIVDADLGYVEVL